jgi:hypothetical protein
MAKILRATQKQFGLTGPSGDFGQFGSLAEGAANYTKDPATIQALSAFLTGWADATLSNNRPALEDMNSLFFLAFTQLCYLFQSGIAEWDSGTTYYINSIVQLNGVIYKSLQDTNLNYNPSTSPTYWTLMTVPTPVSGSQIANKDYVDAHVPASYDSGWFAAAANQTYAKTHNLGTTKVIYKLYFSTESDGSANLSEMIFGDGSYYGSQITDITTITLAVNTFATGIARKLTAGSTTFYTSGYLRVIGIVVG